MVAGCAGGWNWRTGPFAMSIVKVMEPPGGGGAVPVSGVASPAEAPASCPDEGLALPHATSSPTMIRPRGS